MSAKAIFCLFRNISITDDGAFHVESHSRRIVVIETPIAKNCIDGDRGQ